MGEIRMSTGMFVLALIVTGVLAVAVLYPAFKPAAVAPVEYTGEFQDAGVPNEVSGTDLQVERAYDDTGDNFSIVMNTTTVMNASKNAINGQIFYLATRIDIDGAIKSLEVDGTLDSSRTSDCETRRVYLLRDEEGISMDEDDAIYVFDVDDEMEDFDGETGPLTKGDYVLVIEMKPVSVSGSISGNTLYTVELDIDTDGDVDEGVITIKAG